MGGRRAARQALAFASLSPDTRSLPFGPLVPFAGTAGLRSGLRNAPQTSRSLSMPRFSRWPCGPLLFGNRISRLTWFTEVVLPSENFYLVGVA